MKMIRLPLVAVGCLFVVLLMIAEASAAKRPYRFVPLDNLTPKGFEHFDLVAISDRRRIYGRAGKCDRKGFCSHGVAVHLNGKTTVLHKGFVWTANNRGTIGGSVEVDRKKGYSQAALFERGRVKRIPRLRDAEVSSEIDLLTDTRIALVTSFDEYFEIVRYLVRHGHARPLPFGEGFGQLALNNRGRMSGTTFPYDGDSRAFRYSPPMDKLTILEPLPGDTESWGKAINRRGDVLGFSQIPGGRQRIGVWRGTSFHTYFVQGTREFPTISREVLWNEDGLIVLTEPEPEPGDLNSYLVPRPGVRLRLADLTEGPLHAYTEIIDINSRGDMIGLGGNRWGHHAHAFLLLRVGPLEPDRGEAASMAASLLEPPAEDR